MSTNIKPEEVLNHLDLYGTMTACDLGCGAGYFSVPLARTLPGGKVFSIDIQQEPMSVLRREARDNGLSNIRTICADIESLRGSQLRDASVDRVILAHVLNQVRHKQAVLSEAFRILKKGGKIMVVEWRPTAAQPIGPKMAHRINESDLNQMIHRAGGSSPRIVPLGAYHYGALSTKS